ncbi:hypothetical protein [Maribacter sp. 2308TA10-17]
MEQQVTQGVKVLNGFLSVMVVILVGILLSIVVTMLLWSVGIL